MLTQLTIENVAVIEQATIDFAEGLNVFTGETGAGKSILIDALSAILGFRTSRDLVRTGAKKAYMRGVFTDVGAPCRQYLEQNHLPLDEDTLILSREITAEGKNLCKVCGMTVTVSVLKELGAFLVDIHGQQDNLSLMDANAHLAFVDAYGELEPLVEDYKGPFKEMCRLIRMIQNLSLSEAQKQKKIDELETEIAQLEDAALSDAEKDNLQAERALQYHGEKLAADFESLIAPLDGSEDTAGLPEQLQQGIAAAGRLAGFYPALSKLDETYSEIYYQLEDIRSQLTRLADDLHIDPVRLGEIEERLSIYDRFESRYGNVANALAALDQAKEELQNIRLSDEKIDELKEQYAILAPVVKEKAKQLTDARQKTGEQLTTLVCEQLRFMNMPSTKISFAHTLTKLTSRGQDSMELLISANAGEDMRPLAKIASGGELSRIMLAIKSVLGRLDPQRSQVFDEIDAGISGGAAQKVGILLSKMGQEKQVLCVTHLAQIACQADRHLLIEKREMDGRTYTHVTPLERQGQIAELARIISGGSDNGSARQTAGEMLDQAMQQKTDKPPAREKHPAF